VMRNSATGWPEAVLHRGEWDAFVLGVKDGEFDLDEDGNCRPAGLSRAGLKRPGWRPGQGFSVPAGHGNVNRDLNQQVLSAATIITPGVGCRQRAHRPKVAYWLGRRGSWHCVMTRAALRERRSDSMFGLPAGTQPAFSTWMVSLRQTALVTRRRGRRCRHYLRQRAQQTGEKFVPFDSSHDTTIT